MIELGSVLGIGLAFVGGLVSFASPCCLPLVPAYLGYMVGATGEGTAGRRAAFVHGLAFCAGFSLVFVGFYVLLGAIGRADRPPDHQHRERRRSSSFVGLQVAGVINLRALWRDTRALPDDGWRARARRGSRWHRRRSARTPGAAPRLSPLVPVRPAVRRRLEPVHRPHPRGDPRPRGRDLERRPGHGPAGRLRGRPRRSRSSRWRSAPPGSPAG